MTSRIDTVPAMLSNGTSRTLIMGVINATPDSFSDGGVHYEPEKAINSALEMLKSGADIIDVGGESTRPGSDYVETSEELRRVVPVVEGIITERPDAVISVDTRRKIVAEAALDAGALIINDISGFRDDPSMVDLARETDCPVIIMHMLGTPKTMQVNIGYESFPQDVYDFLKERIDFLESSGIKPEKIIIDPGIGFGKTFDQNLILINRLSIFAPLGKPVLMGPSRKAFIGKILDEPVAARRDLGTMGAVAACAMNGAAIVRVHDVASAVQVCKVVDAVRRECADN